MQAPSRRRDLQMKKFDDSKKYYRMASDLDPNDPEPIIPSPSSTGLGPTCPAKNSAPNSA